MPRKFREFTEQRKHLKDEDYMQIAIKEAEKAKLDGNPAIGAVLVTPRGFYADGNTAYSECDHCNHAEINVIRKASGLQDRALNDAILYVTLEPCLMCAMAAYYNGIREVVFGAYDDASGFVSSKLLVDHNFLGITYKGGVLANECISLLPKEYHEHVRTE
jgi:tRNA(adenine34) deaminase